MSNGEMKQILKATATVIGIVAAVDVLLCLNINVINNMRKQQKRNL